MGCWSPPHHPLARLSWQRFHDIPPAPTHVSLPSACKDLLDLFWFVSVVPVIIATEQTATISIEHHTPTTTTHQILYCESLQRRWNETWRRSKLFQLPRRYSIASSSTRLTSWSHPFSIPVTIRLRIKEACWLLSYQLSNYSSSPLSTLTNERCFKPIPSTTGRVSSSLTTQYLPCLPPLNFTETDFSIYLFKSKMDSFLTAISLLYYSLCVSDSSWRSIFSSGFVTRDVVLYSRQHRYK